MADSLFQSRPTARSSLRDAMTHSLAQNGPFLLLIIAYIVGWDAWQLMRAGSPSTTFISKDFFTASIAFVGVTYLLRILYLLAREIPERPFGWLGRIVQEDLPHLALGLPIILLIPAFFGVFGQIKNSMHLLVPVYADPYLAAADRTVFGMDAWEAVARFLPFGVATTFLDYAYLSWFLVMYVAVLTAAFTRSSPERRFRFFATYFMSWILLGNVMAILMDSAGHCFYGAFYGIQPYQPLFDRLHAVAGSVQPVMALNIQQYLMDQFRSGVASVGEGISAFPSLHVAMATLIALFFFDINKLAGILGFAFCALILIGSVVLGWHYAVDGLVSIVAVPLLWAFAGRLYRFQQGSRPSTYRSL